MGTLLGSHFERVAFRNENNHKNATNISTNELTQIIGKEKSKAEQTEITPEPEPMPSISTDKERKVETATSWEIFNFLEEKSIQQKQITPPRN